MTANTSDVPSSSTPNFSYTIPEEILFELKPGQYFDRIQGNREMFISEGLIPSDFSFPDGFISRFFEDKQFTYSLQRVRPPEAKGSRKYYYDIDWFLMIRHSKNAPKWQEVQIELKSKELKNLIYKTTPEGKRKINDEVCRKYKAAHDEKFQLFMNSMIGSVNSKNNRRLNNERHYFNR